MNLRQIFLLIVAVGLIPIAMSYGVMPQKSLLFLFDVSIVDTNSVHIFRAIMGLYLGFALFWILGAFDVRLRQAALYSLVVFMFGLAAGRGLSVIVDGMPHWLLIAYLLIELVIGGIGVFLLKKPD
jgi:uncharacterized MnhB-related membrane protein